MGEKNKTWGEKIGYCLAWVLNKVILWIFALLTISLIFFNNSTMNYDMGLSIAFFLLVVSVIGILIISIQKNQRVYDKLLEKTNWFLAISMLVLVIVQLRFVQSTQTKIGWDVQKVIGCASQDCIGGYNQYFSMYPNNLFLVLLYRRIMNLFHVAENPYFTLDLLNVMAADISILLSYSIIKQWFGKKYGLFTYGISIMTYGLFPWLIVPYSDVLAMVFTVCVLFCATKIRFAEKTGKKIAFLIAGTLFAFIGYLIKPTVVIVLIAIFVTGCLYKMKNLKQFGTHIAVFVCIVSMFIGCSQLWNQHIKDTQPEIDLDAAMPMTHFMMIGLTARDGYYGVYSGDDEALSVSMPTKKEKIEANLEVIKNRIQDYNIAGYMQFLSNKARWMTSEGSFFWGLEGGFAEFDEQKAKTGFAAFIYTNGTQYDIYKYGSQGMWIFLMVCGCLGLLDSKNRERTWIETVTRCTLFGILLFLLLFEGRSRYFILYLPFFIFHAVVGIRHAVVCVNQHSFQWKRRKMHITMPENLLQPVRLTDTKALYTKSVTFVKRNGCYMLAVLAAAAFFFYQSSHFLFGSEADRNLFLTGRTLDSIYTAQQFGEQGGLVGYLTGLVSLWAVTIGSYGSYVCLRFLSSVFNSVAIGLLTRRLRNTKAGFLAAFLYLFWADFRGTDNLFVSHVAGCQTALGIAVLGVYFFWGYYDKKKDKQLMLSAVCIIWSALFEQGFLLLIPGLVVMLQIFKKEDISVRNLVCIRYHLLGVLIYYIFLYDGKMGYPFYSIFGTMAKFVCYIIGCIVIAIECEKIAQKNNSRQWIRTCMGLIIIAAGMGMAVINHETLQKASADKKEAEAYVETLTGKVFTSLQNGTIIYQPDLKLKEEELEKVEVYLQKICGTQYHIINTIADPALQQGGCFLRYSRNAQAVYYGNFDGMLHTNWVRIKTQPHKTITITLTGEQDTNVYKINGKAITGKKKITLTGRTDKNGILDIEGDNINIDRIKIKPESKAN